MEIFIVTVGEYAEYSIEGVFSSLEKANSFCQEYNEKWKIVFDSDKARVETWKVDDIKKEANATRTKS